MRTWITSFVSIICSAAGAATLRVPGEHASIQSAINMAKSGDTVLVAAGAYRERLVLKPGIRVRSEGDDSQGKRGLKRAEATILDGTAGSGPGVEMGLEATLDGFTITGVGKYDDASWQHHFDTQGNEQSIEQTGRPGVPGISVTSNCTVLHNIVHHVGYTGIAIVGASGGKVSPRVTNNVCFRNMGGGIGSMNGSTALIEGNTCFDNLHAGIGCDASSPVVKGNVCHGNIRAGIGISEGSSPAVTGNRCFKNRRAGIGIRTGRDTRPVVEGNECTENDMAGIGVEEGARPFIVKNRLIGNKLVAIGIAGGSDATIKDNELARDGGVAPMIAVLEGSRAVIAGNVIRGGGVAAVLVKGRAEIRENHFIGNGQAANPPANNAVWAHAGAEVTFVGNRIEAWKQAITAAKGSVVGEEGTAFLADIGFRSALDGTEQRYVELMPPGFDAAKSHDVVLAFHGHGADRWQFIKDARGECRGVRDVASRFGLIVVSPDYRAKTSWMGPKAEADVVQIITELKQRHKIGRVFLAGGSMGGTAVLTFAALHPELIAGGCSLNGTANLVEYENFQDARTSSFGGTREEVPDEYRKRSAELCPEKFTMPMAFTTGGKDDSVPPHSVLRLVEKLKKAGRKVLSIHRKDGGHSTTYEDTCAAMEFMLSEAGCVSLSDQEMLLTGPQRLEERLASIKAPNADLLADAAVYSKGVSWALRYDTALSAGDRALVRKALERGLQRADALAAGRQAWTTKKGKVLRGFVSAVDGSTQPYGVIIPQGYDGKKPMRLDVVLHGSSKPVGMSELRFGARFDEGDAEAKSAPDVDYIELHPLGRVENCYRWAGETDVFEAIEAVCRNYRIDRDRMVLRGMSMGASGTWHLGLKHPDRFVAIGPYCGYVDTHRFSETPIPGFIKVGPLPPHQEAGLHMLDSVDYAANASVVPAIAAIGDKDVFFQAHVIMGEAFAKEGLQMVNLISPGTGHVIDPVTHREQLRRIGEHVDRGLDHDPMQLRFVTWTLKYNRCHWLELLSLGRHYERAEFHASVTGDGINITNAKNITRFAIHRPATRVCILGADIPLPPAQPGEALVFTQTGGAWHCDGPRRQITLTGKRPGLQGPIDDAFATPFLCVRGTGKPWNARINDWAGANLRRFEYEWRRYMRGDLPVKKDTEVTEADVRDRHLILFGDPGSNSWIAKALPGMPVEWTRDEVRLGGSARPAKDHAPVLVCASPLAPGRYLVINSGHTFHEKEFAAYNYLLFPRLGDFAMMKVAEGADAWQPSSASFPEEVVHAGYFDEDWRKARVTEP